MPKVLLTEEVLAERTVVLPRQVVLPDKRHHFADPLVKGDVVDVIIKKNGVEIGNYSHTVNSDPSVDCEFRAYVHYGVAQQPVAVKA